ncbi:glycoside hydrolase family 16 protein [uncultured Lutibacter sp.]|uniref:glycoside hydrolase family 16 protein n=1 Tax=uncultured Lutibacter sp. TaxID=437739 RepID=UPI002636C77C|nr:glycoside hydrolase family 16 protein [uncultured Lutibacter sp.]
MKRIFSRLVIIMVMSIALLSCKNKRKKYNSDDHTKIKISISDLNKDSYQPGVDWKLVWSDEFESDKIDLNNWNFQMEEAGRFNDEWQRYTNSNENAYIDDDCLVIKAVHESDTHGMDQYTSARMHTANKQVWKYGRIAARIKLPHGEGLWPAFWMLGANIDENGGDTPWPQTGEIDILELYGSKDDGVIEANVHYADASDSHAMMGASSFKLEQGKFVDAFHIFEFEWDANRIAWFVDGEQFASMPISSDELSEFHKEFFILLNIAVGGKHAGRPTAETTFPQYMYVDWVRVYQKKDQER